MEPVRAPAQEGGGVFFAFSARPRPRQDPRRWRGTATSRGEPPGSRDPAAGSAGRPSNLSGGVRTIGAKAGFAATISNAPSTEPPGLEGPGERHPMLLRKSEDFPKVLKLSGMVPKDLPSNPRGPLEPGGPPPRSRRTWWDPEGPGNTQPPQDPRKGLSSDRPASPAQGGGRGSPEGQGRECPAVAFRADGLGMGPGETLRAGPASTEMDPPASPNHGPP